MQMHETFPLDIKFGKILLTPLRMETVSVHTQETGYRGTEYWLTIHGVEYGLSTAMERGQDGIWRIAGNDSYEQYQRLSARRRDWTSRPGFDDAISRPAREKLVTELETAVTAWANEHWELFRAAEVLALENELESLEQTHKKQMEALQELDTQIESAQARIQELQG